MRKLCILLSIVVSVSFQNVSAKDSFYAYYTNVKDTLTNYFYKDNDVIVVLGKGQQLEFTRLTRYLPLWHTPKGNFLLHNFYPEKDIDSTFDYSYVRVIQNNSKRIIVQWRFIPNIKSLERANQNLDPLIKSGLTGVVQELFTIYPDHTVLREIKDANGTRYEDWINPEHSTIEKLKLEKDGIKEISIKKGKPGPFFPRKGIAGRSVKNNSLHPLRSWNFDEGLKDHEDYVTESVTGFKCPVEGLMTLYKKGVSGTALVFDGYYTGVKMDKNIPHFNDEISVEAWIALDVLPYNLVPIIQLSHNFAESGSFGEGGFYLGVDAYGHIILRVDGVTVQTSSKIPLYKWTNITATVGNGEMAIYIDNKKETSTVYYGIIDLPDDVPLYIGLNSEKERCTDFVRTNEQNLPVILGIQGLIDEVSVYDYRLTNKQIALLYNTYLPADRKSSLAKGILPGELGVPPKFGAYYKTLSLSDLWSRMWRLTNYADIVIKFSDLPTSVIFWHGTNYAPSWVADNNRWFADQSSETWSIHGCSEHMADKQVRLCRSSIIENSPARVVVHWRYPCVDVSYLCTDKRNWTDEYYTIYPDGSGIRSVYWNKKVDQPGFQDDQFLTNPGESALDVMNLQAMTVANLNGDVQKLTWQFPNGIPKITIDNANIELLNPKSENKIYLMFQGGKITPWGDHEQSRYTKDPFAGPWNHWPTTLIPSDGRFAVDSDRVSHFAVGGANDPVTEFGSLVQYGFTKQPIKELIKNARFWCNPPTIKNLKGGTTEGFDKSQRAYVFNINSNFLSFTIDANKNQPIVNPAFVIKGWKLETNANIKINDTSFDSNKIKIGLTRDAEGKKMLIVWFNLVSELPTKIEVN